MGMRQVQVQVQIQDQRQIQLQKLIQQQKQLLLLKLPDGAIVDALEFWDEVFGLSLLVKNEVHKHKFDCRFKQEATMVRAIVDPTSTWAYQHFSPAAYSILIGGRKGKQKRDIFFEVFDGFIDPKNKKEVVKAKCQYYNINKKELDWLECRYYI